MGLPTNPPLVFDPKGHRYSVNGVTIPSVTQIIAPLYDFAMVKEELMNLARERGSVVHAATELWDRDDLDENSVDSGIAPYLAAWKKFRADTGFVPEVIEHQLHNARYGFAGTLDRIGTMPRRGRRAVIDIKTVSRLHRAVGVQLAAYRDSWNRLNPGVQIADRYAVQLAADGTYKLEEYKDQNDWPTFLALLNVHNWKQQCK